MSGAPEKEKLRIESKYAWDNHHRGGWLNVMEHLARRYHHESGTLFLSAVEDRLWYQGAVTSPWVGVIHQVPRQHYKFPDVSRLLEMPQWQQSVGHCAGIFVLCDYLRRFLNERVPGLLVNVISYPQDIAVPGFSWERHREKPSVVQIGEFLRNHQAFFDLNAVGYSKVLLANERVRKQFVEETVVQNDTVRITERIADASYDELLCSSVVFLNLTDAVAVTAVHECIVRRTPVLVNKVGALPEFLGEDYPLFYSNLVEAEKFLADQERIRAAHTYLSNLNLRRYTFEHFDNLLETSAIYRSLPSPSLVTGNFQRFDLSIVIFSYRRASHIPALLQALANQNFKGTFEIVLWNNNIKETDFLTEALKSLPPGLVVRVIHSSQNYYCMPRLALAALVRAPLVMFCDDDVLPSNSYIRHFVDRLRELQTTYGERIAISARGHRFKVHTLSQHIEKDVWNDPSIAEFFDEEAADCEVHFMHADNLILPTVLLREAANLGMPHDEWALVDDYWMSFVLAHYLGAALIKIKADDVFKFTPEADDPNIALFHNPAVRHERMRLYIHHMKMGWPAGQPLAAERAGSARVLDD